MQIHSIDSTAHAFQSSQGLHTCLDSRIFVLLTVCVLDGVSA